MEGGWGVEVRWGRRQGNVFLNVCLFSSSLKKNFFFYPYLLGLGRKGQKPRIGKKYFFPFNQKNTPWGQSEIPDNLSHLWKHDS